MKHNDRLREDGKGLKEPVSMNQGDMEAYLFNAHLSNEFSSDYYDEFWLTFN